MKKTTTIFLSALVIMVSLVGCGANGNNSNSEGLNAIAELRAEEMRLSGELMQNEVILTLQGESDALKDLDFSEYANIMEKNDSLLKYSDLYEWMTLEGFIDSLTSYDPEKSTISDEDYTKVMASFYGLSDEDKSKVLSHMFQKTGSETLNIALDFGYVPTGETTDDGETISTYDATNAREISIGLYSNNPLKIELK